MANPMYGQNKADDKLDLLANGKNLGVETLTAATTLKASDSGKLIAVNAAAIAVTLPSAEAGMWFDFVFFQDTTAGATIVASSGDCFFGTVKVFSTTADQGAVQQSLTHATAIGTVADYDNLDFVHDSATLGGKAGDSVRLIAVDDTAWMVSANLVTDHANPGTIAAINAG
tara:strand:- start:466 stop:978 length:513 start_codon:yes stop_codon:yes gene_type:complete